MSRAPSPLRKVVEQYVNAPSGSAVALAFYSVQSRDDAKIHVLKMPLFRFGRTPIHVFLVAVKLQIWMAYAVLLSRVLNIIAQSVVRNR